MKHAIQFVVLVLVLQTVFLFYGYSVDQSVQSMPDNEFVSILNAKAEKLLRLYNVPGLAVAIIRDGVVIWSGGYGWADRKRKEPVNGNTLFQVASNSKCVAAWGIMRLVQEHRIDLDIPVQNYITRWHLPPSIYGVDGVTVRRLLSHTAGLSARAFPGYSPGSRLPALEESLSGISTGQPGVKIISKPGKKYLYSGGGYTILQLMVEEITGQPFSDYMQKEVFTPLGMTRSSYEWTPALLEKISTAYDISGNPIPNYVFTEKAAAGLITTAEDFARFIAAYINIQNSETPETKRLSRETIALMFTPIKEYHGLGYKIRIVKDNTHYVYHGGTNRGWRSQFALLPERGMGIVILTNSDNGEDVYSDILRLWTRSVLGFVPGFLNKVIIFRFIIWGLVLGSGIFLIVFLIKFISGIGSKRYKFLVFCRSGQLKYLFMVIGKVMIAVLLFITWYIVFYTGIPYNGWIIAGKMPFGFFYLSLLFFLWCIVISIFFLFKKEKAIKNQNIKEER